MERNTSYQTRQKALIRDQIEHQHKYFTAKEIMMGLDRQGEEVGLTTIYRVIETMLKAGQVKKIIDDGNPKYLLLSECDSPGHCILQCKNCGKLEHADCQIMREFSQHLNADHHFIISQHELIIDGTKK